MNFTPLVSAIIPTYNRARLVCEAIESVLCQTYSHIEIIVVDDGSTDNTPDELKHFGNRIRIITQRNAGPSSARNRGIAASHGELIAFLDSDDLWLPTKLERQVQLLQRSGEAVPCCLCNIMMHWTGKKVSSFEISRMRPVLEEGLWLNPAEVLATRFLLFNQGAVIRRSTLDAIGGYDPRLRLLEDYELALRLALVGPWTFIREPLVVWRETAGSCYQGSRGDDTHVQQLLEQILERSLAASRSRRQNARAAQLIADESKRAQRQARLSRMKHSDQAGTRMLASSLELIERLRRAAFLRSPGFPQMQTSACDISESCSPQTEDVPDSTPVHAVAHE